MLSRRSLWFLMIGWGVSLLWVFGAGYLLRAVLKPAAPLAMPPLPSPEPVVSPVPLPTPSQEGLRFVPVQYPELPGANTFFDDTLTVLIESQPRQLLVSTYTRSQHAGGFTHTARASYFDGTAWHREVASEGAEGIAFVTSKVIPRLDIWKTADRVLRQRVDTQVSVEGVTFDLETGVLANEITYRAEPEFTRLISDGSGQVRVNGQVYQARVMYTRWYSMDQSKVAVYNQTYGLQSKVIDFWADDGSVFHLDATKVANPDAIYDSHQIAAYKAADGGVYKSFGYELVTDAADPPTTWQVAMDDWALQFAGTTTSVFRRSEGDAYNWHRGMLSGTLRLRDGTEVAGVGTFETILEVAKE